MYINQRTYKAHFVPKIVIYLREKRIAQYIFLFICSYFKVIRLKNSLFGLFS